MQQFPIAVSEASRSEVGVVNDDVAEELAMLTEAVNGFADSEIAPHYPQWERDGIFPRELWNQLGEAGFLCTDIPEEFGGAGADLRISAVILRELSRRGFNAIAVSLSVHSDIVAHYLLNRGTDEQKAHYLPQMASGESVGAIAMTEPGAGSDLQAIGMRAVERAGGFALSGSKTFITNGQHADFVVTAARTDPDVPGSRGTTLFIVDATTPGFQRGRNLEKIGLHASDTSELFYEDVVVPESAILGELNRGFALLMQELGRERLALAICAVGAMRGALADTVSYVRERRMFGKRLSDFQNTRHRLAEMQTDYRLASAFVEQCIAAHLDGSLDVESASIAKLAASEAQGRVVDGCLQLFGGYGYMTEYPIARAFVDARVQRIYGGTSEVMKELISRSVLA